MNRIKEESTLARSAIIVTLLAAAVFVSIGSCSNDTKTILCEASGLRCRSDQICTVDQDACINVGGCGDGIQGEGEACDDGNHQDDDGCKADCTSDESCGNNFTDKNESCDDGNIISGDGCSENCIKEECGDKTINNKDEQCDTEAMDTPGCDSDCSFAVCGDGHWNNTIEDCDAFNRIDTPTCNKNCTHAVCGDLYVNTSIVFPEGIALEECDTGGDTSICNGSKNTDGRGNCHIPRCGDGYINEEYKPDGFLTEKCDTLGGANKNDCNGNDSNNDRNPDNDTENGNCQIPTCGDGYINPEYMPDNNFIEQCDTLGGENTADCNGTDSNGDNIHNNDSKKGYCRISACHDGYFNRAAGEECETNVPCTSDVDNHCNNSCHCVPESDSLMPLAIRDLAFPLSTRP